MERKKPGRPRKQERRHRHSEYLTPEHFKLWNKVKSDSIFRLSTNSDFAKGLLERFLFPGHVLFSGKTSGNVSLLVTVKLTSS